MTETTTGTPQEQTETLDLTESERHQLLAGERRRIVLDVLSDQETELTLAELATRVGARESDSSTEAASQMDVQIALHHVHLPLIAEKGLVRYDYETKRVEPHKREIDLQTA